MSLERVHTFTLPYNVNLPLDISDILHIAHLYIAAFFTQTSILLYIVFHFITFNLTLLLFSHCAAVSILNSPYGNQLIYILSHWFYLYFYTFQYTHTANKLQI